MQDHVMRLQHFRAQSIGIIFVLAFSVILLVPPDAAALPSCGTVTIPLRLDSSRSDFEVTASWLTVEPEGSFRCEISLRNETGHSLSRLTVIVNYLNQDGSILFSIPYQANLSNEGNELRNIRAFTELRLSGPVKSGEEVRLTGRTLLSITMVPASAEIVYYFAKHSGDNSSPSTKVGLHGFRTDPLLVETPGDYVRLALVHPTEPVKTLLKLRVNEYGRVLDVQPGPEGNRGMSRDQFQALSQQLIQWRFFPAVENGYAVPSDLYTLVEFVPENPLPVRRCFLENADRDVSKFALVILQPVAGSSDRWIPYYGGFPAGGKMETNVIE